MLILVHVWFENQLKSIKDELVTFQRALLHCDHKVATESNNKHTKKLFYNH